MGDRQTRQRETDEERLQAEVKLAERELANRKEDLAAYRNREKDREERDAVMAREEQEREERVSFARERLREIAAGTDQAAVDAAKSLLNGSR